MQLDTAGPVDEIQERGTPLPPPGGQPPGHAGPHLGLLTWLKLGERRLHIGDRPHAGEGVRERLDALVAQRGELAPALSDKFVAHTLATSILVIFSSRALPFGSVTLTTSPRLFPSSALPTGDSFDSRFSPGFASVEPTIVYWSDLPEPSSLTLTTEPDAHDVVRQLRGVDHRRRAQLVLQ